MHQLSGSYYSDFQEAYGDYLDRFAQADEATNPPEAMPRFYGRTTTR